MQLKASLICIVFTLGLCTIGSSLQHDGKQIHDFQDLVNSKSQDVTVENKLYLLRTI